MLFAKNLVSLHRRVWGRGWKRLVIAIVITVAGITIFLLASMEVTSRPKFCSTCHYMKPYYQSWQESSHKHVTCTDCHFPPGFKNKLKGKFTAFSMLVNYFTGVYKKGKPWAEITDQSCLRSGCHETRLLSGKATFKKGIIFDHEPHLKELRREKKLRCTSCHSQIVQGTHLSVTESSCFLCHFKETTSDSAIHDCRKCHEPPVAGTPDSGTSITKDHSIVLDKEIACQKCHGQMVVGDGAVPKSRCSSCHAEIETINRYADTEFIHKNHITDHKIECDQCHTEIQHKSVALSNEVKPDCHACHPDFHRAQLEMFTGTGGKEVPNHPSSMFLAGLNCQACHIYHQFPDGFADKGETIVAKAESCEPCHGKGYYKILQAWESQTARKLVQIEQVLAVARKRLESRKKDAAYPDANKKLDQATFNYKLVKYGRAIHNIVFATQLLEKTYQLAAEALKDLKFDPALPYFEHETKAVPGQCSGCHAGVERTETEIFGWKFPHYKHLVVQKMECQQCHSNQKKHGEIVVTKNGCMSCHHRETKGECSVCHERQYQVYFSKLPFSTLDLPNVMASSVSCRDCHQHEKQLRRSRKQDCSECHDTDYEALFSEWQNASLELLSQLRDKIKRENLQPGHRAVEVLLLLERDGSRGIHNPELYEKLIADMLK